MKPYPMLVLFLGLAVGGACGRAKSAPEDTTPPGRGGFILRSPAVAADGALPAEFTGDGIGTTPPLEWRGAPAGTRSYALIMHHIDPEGLIKWYWTLPQN